MKSSTQVINLHGGPGVGKSTIAAGVFSKLKAKNVSVELVVEFPKEITWEETQKLLENQIYIFSEQFRRQWRLLDKVDFVITDSPLLLYSIYFDYYLDKLNKKHDAEIAKYNNLCREFFDQTYLQFHNIDYFISRRFEEIDGKIVYPDYEISGRNQNIQEAINLDKKIRDKLYKYDAAYRTVSGKVSDVVNVIVKDIMANDSKD